ncbi:hypothetical protein KBD34_04845 [Patescibacteria group bacterium]|nr:hypothetical protein [Patescibacteria group bacterium]
MNFRKLLLTAALLLIGAIAPAQPRPPQRPMAPRRPAATAVPEPSNGSCARLIATPNLVPDAALIRLLSTDIHDHQRDPGTTRCATELAARLIRARRAPEAQEFVGLLRRLPQSGAVYGCLDDLEQINIEAWSTNPDFMAAVSERRGCLPGLFTRAARLPTRCVENLPAGLHEMAYQTLRRVGDICSDDPPGFAIMATLVRFNRPADAGLIRYWTEHREELPGGIAHATLIYATRELIERNVVITREGVEREPITLRRELRAFIERTAAVRRNLFTTQTRVEEGTQGRFTPTESDGIAAAGYLRFSIQLARGDGSEVTLTDLIRDIAFLRSEHLFEDDRVRPALIDFNPSHFTEGSSDPAYAQMLQTAIDELPNDAAHFSLMKLRLRWILATRRIPLTQPPVLPHELELAYRGFQPAGEATQHPGLPREVVLQTLFSILERAQAADLECRRYDGCSASRSDLFRDELRWIRQELGLPVSPPLVLPTVNNVQPIAPRR